MAASTLPRAEYTTIEYTTLPVSRAYMTNNCANTIAESLARGLDQPPEPYATWLKDKRASLQR